MPTDARERIHNLLRAMPTRGLDAAKRLFWTELNYDRVAEPLSSRYWGSKRAREALAQEPQLLAQHGADGGRFDIIYIKLAADEVGRGFPLSLSAERAVIEQLLNNHPYALFLFSDEQERYWHLVNVRYAPDAKRRRIYRRITIGPEERLRTACERVSLLDIESMQGDLFGLSPMAIQMNHDVAFDVEAVSRDFYDAYLSLCKGLKEYFQKQVNDERWARDYALQFLNRVMFLYYVQRKRWLGDDPDFLANFWRAYRQAGSPGQSFVEDWLHILFFEAFNRSFQAGRADRAYLPDHIRATLALAPYLNGGLFRRNDLDRVHAVHIDDDTFKNIFDFFEGYNFTISEDTPLDLEVAVDPEMIGRVYESLVNVSTETDEQGEAGIFYTPRVELDLMCRLTLIDWLVNHLGEERRQVLTEALFAFGPTDKEEADRHLTQENLWTSLNELLRRVTAVDPACGSGSFLVGMLYVLDDLLERSGRQLGTQESAYERKKGIIASSLYGVDVMEWAVHVAELRLWLQLVIDTEMKPAELTFRPLLPNLSFKIRPGDSIVQEVGGMNLGLHREQLPVSASLKGRLTQLKGKKRRYFAGEEAALRRADVEREEYRLFHDILADKAKSLQERVKRLTRQIDAPPQQNAFAGMDAPPDADVEKNLRAWRRERDAAQAELDIVRRALGSLTQAGDVPFVWDIAFVEIFEGGERGFDIVIGNPPYVRQEAIRDPRQTSANVTAADKRAYKAKLARSVYAAWPKTFGYDWVTDQAKTKIGGRSDLYIYFYLHGISLLNDRGAFCFITSNSWLDVGYGAELQDFLLTRGRVSLILDNQARRSFSNADVNTIIALLGAAHDAPSPRAASLDHTARFVMLTVPFEEALSAVIWQEVAEADRRTTTAEFRVRPISQRELRQSGMDPDKDKYTGDKWGGKYLRAPDIYWAILEKAGDKLVRLGDVADVRRGITTGANEFFFLDRSTVEKWGIERRFLQPVLVSPTQQKSVIVQPDKLQSSVFMCHEAKRALRGTAALEYIRWGESRDFNRRRTCAARARWWDLGVRDPSPLNCNYQVNEVMRFYIGSQPFLVSDNFQEVHPHVSAKALALACNSSVCQLDVNIRGRSNFGGGLLKVQTSETADLMVPDPRRIPDEAYAKLDTLASNLGLQHDDRQLIDQIVFEALGLTLDERDAVYEELFGLVETRLAKAHSV